MTARLSQRPGQGTLIEIKLPLTQDVTHDKSNYCLWTTIKLCAPVYACCSWPSQTLRSWARPAAEKRPWRRLPRCQPDIVLMDAATPGMSGMEATCRIKEAFPNVAVLALTMHEDERDFFEMLNAGAVRYVPK